MTMQLKILTLLLATNFAIASDTVATPKSATTPAEAIKKTDGSATQKAVAERTTEEKSDNVAAVAPVLALAPEDALVIFYLDNPSDLLEHPVWEALDDFRNQEIDELRKVATETFTGPVMFAICGSPANPLTLRVEVATQPADGTDQFFKQLNEQFFATIGRIAPCNSGSVEPSGKYYAIRSPMMIPFPILAGAKDGIVYGSSRPADVDAWLAGDELSPRFVDGEDAKRLSADAIKQPRALGYFNVRELWPLANQELERTIPGITEVLDFDAIEFGAVTINRAKTGDAISATIGVSDNYAGFIDIVAPMNAPLEIADLFLSDNIGFVRGTWTNAADWVDSLTAIAGAIDRDIVDEFRAECADFRAEYGIDPLEDFVGNFVGEWIVGANFEGKKRPSIMAAFELADALKFQTQARGLINAFDLEVDATWCAQTQVTSASAESGISLAWATQGKYLLVSDQAETLCATIARQTEDTAGEGAIPLREVVSRLPEANAPMAYLNVSALARFGLAMGGDDVAKEPELTEILTKLEKANAGLAVALRRDEGALNVNLALSESVGAELQTLAWKSVGASLERSREMSKRLVSMSKIQGFLMACNTYAHDNKNAWPESLSVFLETGDVSPGMYRAPFDASMEEITAANADRLMSYLYRNGTGLDSDDVVICERTLRDGGANFGFADGHVEWIEGPRAEQLLNMMRRESRQ